MIHEEEDIKIKTFKTLFDKIESGLDETAYNIMHHNFKFMDNILKTNIKTYLIDLMKDKGFNILHNNEIINKDIKKKVVDKKEVIDKLVEILKLDKDNLDNFHQRLVSDGNSFEKHMNLRVWLASYTTINEKIFSHIQTNLFSLFKALQVLPL